MNFFLGGGGGGGGGVKFLGLFFHKKVPFLANIERCPKFLEYVLKCCFKECRKEVTVYSLFNSAEYVFEYVSIFQWELWLSTVFVKLFVLDKYFYELSAFFHFSLTLGFSLSIALFAFEMMTFLAGITMFIASVSLLCIFFMRTSFLKSSHQKCSIKKLFLKFLQYSQENTCVGVSF